MDILVGTYDYGSRILRLGTSCSIGHKEIEHSHTHLEKEKAWKGPKIKIQHFPFYC